MNEIHVVGLLFITQSKIKHKFVILELFKAKLKAKK